MNILDQRLESPSNKTESQTEVKIIEGQGHAIRWEKAKVKLMTMRARPSDLWAKPKLKGRWFEPKRCILVYLHNFTWYFVNILFGISPGHTLIVSMYSFRCNSGCSIQGLYSGFFVLPYIMYKITVIYIL